MAPPVPVYSHADVGKLHKFPLDPATGQPACPLKELTQYECEVYGKEIVCVPFKRLFRACRLSRDSPRETLIEVTDASTNLPIDYDRLRDSPYLANLKRKQ